MRKDDFPFFDNNESVYLDNAATTQKPQKVLSSIMEYYTSYCANTHRGSYETGNKATREFEEARKVLQNFLGACEASEVVFTKGVTESINMTASSFVGKRFPHVIISSLEHHSNIVPWHMQGRSPGQGLEVVHCSRNLDFDLDHYETLLKKNPGSFVSVTHISNAFGVIHPVKEIVELAHFYDSPVLIDGAQSLSKIPLNMEELGADFYAVSAHKAYGPTGVGALYINRKRVKEMKPWQTGGATIESVTYEGTKLLEPPLCFEAGTQNIAGVIGFKAALEYLQSADFDSVKESEEKLTARVYEALEKLEGVEIYNRSKTGIISFNLEGIAPVDIGILLDKQGVAVRTGHHCIMPLMKLLNMEGTIRVSLALYNDEHDIDKFAEALKKAVKIVRG